MSSPLLSLPYSKDFEDLLSLMIGKIDLENLVKIWRKEEKKIQKQNKEMKKQEKKKLFCTKKFHPVNTMFFIDYPLKCEDASMKPWKMPLNQFLIKQVLHLFILLLPHQDLSRTGEEDRN